MTSLAGAPGPLPPTVLKVAARRKSNGSTKIKYALVEFCAPLESCAAVRVSVRVKLSVPVRPKRML
jgi:hypothetical protein